MPSFIFNSRLKVIDSSSWDIKFSKGRIIFKEDAVKVEFSFDMVMLYLNYTWEKQTTNPVNVLGKQVTENNPVVWNSFNFKSFVKGNLITPNTSAEFINAPGNIDLVKSKKIPVKINGLLWSRLQNKEIDLAYSFIFNKASRKSELQLSLLHDKKLIDFSDINYQVYNEKVSRRPTVKYPGNMLLTARNEEYQVSINIHDNSEVTVSEMVNNVDFTGRLLNWLFRHMSGYPKVLNLLAKTDIVIKDNLARTEFTGINSISEFVSFAR